MLPPLSVFLLFLMFLAWFTSFYGKIWLQILSGGLFLFGGTCCAFYIRIFIRDGGNLLHLVSVLFIMAGFFLLYYHETDDAVRKIKTLRK